MSKRRDIAILGGGMAGLAAAWRLSESEQRARFGRITVYQRGWRLGGKGASGRGIHGRIEEHGLHVWLGHYENAFRLMRDMYEALDRERTNPTSPVRTWSEAFVPANDIGIFDLHDNVWRPWVGHFAPNDQVPGDTYPSLGGNPATLLSRVTRLLTDLVESVGEGPTPTLSASPDSVVRRPRSTAATAILAAGAMVEGVALAGGPIAQRAGQEAVSALDVALSEARAALADMSADDWCGRQTWHMIGVTIAIVRGAIAEGLFDDIGRARDLNDVEFLDWLRLHGASDETVNSTYVRGLYDLVFGHAGGDPDRPGFGAGLGAVLSIKTLLDYRGAFFWKMTAGMGDIVFAPLYQALRERGVDFEFFHRVEAVHLDANETSIDSITMDREAALRAGLDHYAPLVDVKGLPCFPSQPLLDQLAPGGGTRTLQRGVDFDDVVFAMPPPVAATTCAELIAARREWRDLVANVATVATQSLQLWLREDELTLGWHEPGATMTGYVDGFDTWSSMPQLIAAEDWPEVDRPRAIAYFCNTLADDATDETVRATVERFCRDDLPTLLPKFNADALCGGALDAQYWSANVDPSDRYVQSLPGTDKFRLRPDESGFDNMVLAGDWTDCGLNAGCIEAAVMSGLQAANALTGRHRFHRILGIWVD